MFTKYYISIQRFSLQTRNKYNTNPRINHPELSENSETYSKVVFKAYTIDIFDVKTKKWPYIS